MIVPVADRLSATLDCFLAQDDPHWQAVICCQERPPLPDDPRISFLPFSAPEPGNDKWLKLAALTAHLDEMDLPPSYVMSFDADDLLRQGSVREMLRRQAPGGYLVTCSCSYHVNEEMFAAMLHEASIDSRIPVSVVEKRMQGRDHPVLVGVPGWARSRLMTRELGSSPAVMRCKVPSLTPSARARAMSNWT